MRLKSSDYLKSKYTTDNCMFLLCEGSYVGVFAVTYDCRWEGAILLDRHYSSEAAATLNLCIVFCIAFL